MPEYNRVKQKNSNSVNPPESFGWKQDEAGHHMRKERHKAMEERANTDSARRSRPADVLLDHFNRICRLKVKPYDKNIRLIDEGLELNGQDEKNLVDYMSWYCAFKNDQDLKPDLEECMHDYCAYIRFATAYEAVGETDRDVEENMGIKLEDLLQSDGSGAFGNDGSMRELVQFYNRKIEEESGREESSLNVIKGNAKQDEFASWQAPEIRKEKRRFLKENEAGRGQAKEKAPANGIQMKPASGGGRPSQPVKISMESVAGEIRKLIAEALKDQGKRLLEEIKKEALDYLKRVYGERAEAIKVLYDDDRQDLMKGEVAHEKLQEILDFVTAGEPVYLVGPAGCGKNYVCGQVARILNLPFYFSNAVTQEYKLTGFTDANGTFHETQFYKAFKNGGLFLLDEMDASVPDALIVLNAAISNGYFDFPAPVGFVEASPDFRVIAAGNTWGNGADIQYVGRNQLDMASLDRFAVVWMDYSPRLEFLLCPDQELRFFLREYRKAMYENGIMSVVSYRAFRRMYLLEGRFEKLYECLDSCLCKGLCKDDLLMIWKRISSESRYKDALKELIKRREQGDQGYQ